MTLLLPLTLQIWKNCGTNADSKLVVIDHHIANTNYGYLNYIDDNFISTAEMVLLC